MEAGIEHPSGTWTHLEGIAAADGRFLLDSSQVVDWVYGDHLWVGQCLNANVTVHVSDGSAYVTIIAPIPTPTNTPTATPSHDGPPYIQVATPEGPLFARRTYTLTVTVGDVDNNVASVMAEQQLGMGDRYAGKEYVTAQVLPVLVLDAQRLVLRADYPGNCRVWVRAVDTTGLTSEKSVDLGVYWAPGENPFEFRGVCDGGFHPATIDEAFVVLDRTNGDGANYVQLNPQGHMEGSRSTEIIICNPSWSIDGPCDTYSDEILVDIINAAHQRELKVMIKPQLYVGDGTPAWQITLSTWDNWFESCTAFLQHYALIAQAHQVEMFCIGNELLSTHTERDNWIELVSEVRQVYDGPLTYSDLWVARAGFYQYSEFPAWSLLDFIGVSYYPATTGEYTPDPANANPSVGLMEKNMMIGIKQRAEVAHLQYGLDVIATETGGSAIDGLNITPGEGMYPPGAVPDNQEQVDYYEARYRVIVRLPWFLGTMEWKMQMRDPPYIALGQVIAPDIREQPVEKAMCFWWADLTEGK